MKTKRVIVDKFDVVLIKWIDAVSCPGWKDIEEWSIHPYYVNSVGMFLGEDEKHWTLCLNYAWFNDQVSDTVSIPKRMITHVEVLKRAKTL